MPGIPREVAEHALKIRPSSKLLKQRLCCFDKEKRMAIGEEIAKLLAAKEVLIDPSGPKGKVLCIGTMLSSK